MLSLWLIVLLVLATMSDRTHSSPLTVDDSQGIMNSTNPVIRSFEAELMRGTRIIIDELSAAWVIQMTARTEGGRLSTRWQDFTEYSVYCRINNGQGPAFQVDKLPFRRWSAPRRSTPAPLWDHLGLSWYFPMQARFSMAAALQRLEEAGYGNQWRAVHLFWLRQVPYRWPPVPQRYVYGFTRNQDRSPNLTDFAFVGAINGDILIWPRDSQTEAAVTKSLVETSR